MDSLSAPPIKNRFLRESVLNRPTETRAPTTTKRSTPPRIATLPLVNSSARLRPHSTNHIGPGQQSMTELGKAKKDRRLSTTRSVISRWGRSASERASANLMWARRIGLALRREIRYSFPRALLRVRALISHPRLSGTTCPRSWTKVPVLSRARDQACSTRPVLIGAKVNGRCRSWPIRHTLRAKNSDQGRQIRTARPID